MTFSSLGAVTIMNAGVEESKDDRQGATRMIRRAWCAFSLRDEIDTRAHAHRLIVRACKAFLERKKLRHPVHPAHPKILNTSADKVAPTAFL